MGWQRYHQERWRSPLPPFPVIKAGVDRDCDPTERHSDEHPAKRIEIRDQRQDGGLRLGEHRLRDLHPGRAQRRDTRRAATFHRAAVGQHLAHRRRVLDEGSRPHREAVAPLGFVLAPPVQLIWAGWREVSGVGIGMLL